MSTTRPAHRTLTNPFSKHEAERRQDVQNRIADAITRFAGSMTFVYVHLVWFTCWIVFRVERYPYGLLTMIVSLEAIFMSTFILISQNRQDARRQVVADEQWRFVQMEETQNEELIALSNQILALTKDVHAMTSELRARGDGQPPTAGA